MRTRGYGSVGWLLGLIPLLVGCTEPAKFDPLSNFKLPQSIAEVGELCSKIDPHKQRNQDLLFPKPVGQCDWGNNDNVSYDPSTQFAMYENVITARRQQVVSLNIPPEAAICSAGFSFASQQMVFEDEIFLTFNDVVLASSFDYSDRLGLVNGLQSWDWSKLKPTHYLQSDGAHPYCLGASSSDGSCHIPKTQTTGAMTLSFSTNAVYPLRAKAIADKRYDFGFITTGDKNTDTDCSHLDFRMSVALDYVEIPKSVFRASEKERRSWDKKKKPPSLRRRPSSSYTLYSMTEFHEPRTSRAQIDWCLPHR